MDDVYFIETPKQCDMVLKNHSNYMNSLLVAFSPNLYVRLKKGGFNLENYSKLSLMYDHHQISEESFRIYAAITKVVKREKYFHHKSALDSFEVYLKFLINHIVFLDFVINNYKKNYNICLFDDRESCFFLSRGSDTPPHVDSSSSFVDKIIRTQWKCQYNNNFKEKIELNGWSKALNRLILSKIKNKKTLVYGESNGNMTKYIAQKMDANEFGVIKFRLKSKSRLLESLWSIINCSKTFFGVKSNIAGINVDAVLSIGSSIDRQYANNILDTLKKLDVFKLNGLKFHRAMEEKLTDIVLYSIRIDSAYNEVNYLVNKLRYPLLLSMSSRDITAILGEVFVLNDLNHYLISHGTHTLNNNENTNSEHKFLARGLIDTECYKGIVVQSKYAMDYMLNNKADKKNIELSYPIMWGSGFDGESVINSKNEQIIVLHASTPKPVIRPILYETEFEYIVNVLNLIDSISKVNNIKLVIRFRESKNISIDTLKFFIEETDKVEIVTDKTFVFYLLKSNILVSYSSTAIEEAISNDIPVVLFGNNGLYKHIPDTLDDGGDVNVYFAKDREDLIGSINVISRTASLKNKNNKKYYNNMFNVFESV